MKGKVDCDVRLPCSTSDTDQATHVVIHLVCRYLGSGNNVAVEVVVDIGSVSAISRLDVSGNLSGRRRLPAAAASDLELSAGDVKLRWATRVVDTELLDAKKILSSRNLRGDGNGVGGCEHVSSVCRAVCEVALTAQIPCGLAAGEGRANFLDLEPVARTIGCRSCIGLGHVKRHGALVIDGLIRSEGDG